jgi:hypothetical protein
MKSTNHEGRKGQNRLAHSIAGLHEVVRPRTILVVLIAIAACATVGTAYAQTLIDSTVIISSPKRETSTKRGARTAIGMGKAAGITTTRSATRKIGTTMTIASAKTSPSMFWN